MNCKSLIVSTMVAAIALGGRSLFADPPEDSKPKKPATQQPKDGKDKKDSEQPKDKDDKDKKVGDEKPGAKVGQTAPTFTLKDSAGKVYKLADYKDKIVVLE